MASDCYWNLRYTESKKAQASSSPPDHGGEININNYLTLYLLFFSIDFDV